MLEIKSFEFGPFGTNTFVLSSSPSGEAGNGFILLVDPACSNQYEQQQLYAYISNLESQYTNCQLQIVATHGHLDHLWGAKWAAEQWHTPVLMHEADIPMAEAMQDQYSLFGIRMKAEPFPIEPLAVLRSPFTVIHTPGHTPGSICLYWPEDKVLVSGDTLFQMGYGRTDLPGGNFGQLMASLERLLQLPADTKVYPGHGNFTTIGAENRSVY